MSLSRRTPMGPSGVILRHERVSLTHPAGVITSRPASEGRSNQFNAVEVWNGPWSSDRSWNADNNAAVADGAGDA